MNNNSTGISLFISNHWKAILFTPFVLSLVVSLWVITHINAHPGMLSYLAFGQFTFVFIVTILYALIKYVKKHGPNNKLSIIVGLLLLPASIYIAAMISFVVMPQGAIYAVKNYGVQDTARIEDVKFFKTSSVNRGFGNNLYPSDPEDASVMFLTYSYSNGSRKSSVQYSWNERDQKKYRELINEIITNGNFKVRYLKIFPKLAVPQASIDYPETNPFENL